MSTVQLGTPFGHYGIRMHSGGRHHNSPHPQKKNFVTIDNLTHCQVPYFHSIHTVNVQKFAVYSPFNISLMKKSVKWGEEPQIHPDSMWQSGSEK